MQNFIQTFWNEKILFSRSGINLQKYIKFILLFLFAIFIFWFIGRNLEWDKVGDKIKQANRYYLILATLIICLGYFLRALRWKVLLEPITKSSLKELFATTTVGFTAVFFVGRAGEIVRPMWLPMRDKRVRPSSALVTLAVERIFDLAAIICFFAINLIWFNAPVGHENEFNYVKFIGNLLLVGTALGFLSLFIYQKYSPQFIAWAEKITDKKFVPRRLRRIFISLLKQLAASLQILKNWREIFSVVFWTIMLWLSIAVPTWLVILAFNLPVTITLGGAMFIMGFAAIGSLVPTPGGGAGGFHYATMQGLIFLNVLPTDALAVSIVMHLIYFAPALIFGFYYLFHGDISIKQFRSLLSSDHAVEEIEEGESGVLNQQSKENSSTLDSRLSTQD
jgi:glycosyltransferase 2 family protein